MTVVYDESHAGSQNSFELVADERGYYSGSDRDVKPEMKYWLRLDGSGPLLPDPASRFQPAGPTGPSQIIDPADFDWHESNWPGVPLSDQVLYEMHIGTFTRAGSWEAATAELVELAELGNHGD